MLRTVTYVSARLNIEEFERGWQKDLSLDGGGVPHYWQPHCQKWVYIDVTNDTEYVHDWGGKLTIMWWDWDDHLSCYVRRVRTGWYPTRFDPKRS